METRRQQVEITSAIKRPAYFSRLSRRDQLQYLASEKITSLPYSSSWEARHFTRKLLKALETGKTSIIQTQAQALVDRLCQEFKVPSVVVEVRGARPVNRRGELHGLFISSSQEAKRNIIIWSRTAKRRDPVKPKTFFRTLIHEFIHHLDYSFLKLKNSFHTSGFYKRESFLMRELLADHTFGTDAKYE